MGHERNAEPRKVTGPRGEEFELVGRAGPIRLERAPRIPAEAARDLLVVKQGDIFACSGRNGDIRPGVATGEGVYADDTRYLSQLTLRLGGRAPVLLSSFAGAAYEAFVDLTNPDIVHARSVVVPQMTLMLRRIRLVAERVYERILLRNHRRADAEAEIELTLAADFADIFEIRGVSKRMSRGQLLAPKRLDDGIVFSYIGEDEVFRQTIVHLDPSPASVDLVQEKTSVRWRVALSAGEATELRLSIEPSLEGRRRGGSFFESAEHGSRSAFERWRQRCTKVRALHQSFNRFIDASIRDLCALMTPVDGREIVTAGVPWYVAPFGRDALLTCYESMLMNPEPARDTLLFLASYQADVDDPLRDAEPGKILHELRVGELARGGFIPHTPYYGTVDATPLFLMLASAYHRWTADLETMERLRPAFDRALEWMDRYGDRDGDGFLEYQRRSPAGLDNHGWKDSEDCIVHADGALAEPPIALVEVQGYVYLAKQRIAEVYDELGASDVADELRRQAAALREAFNEAFWMADEGTFALALDGRKRQVKSVTSNPGHCLYCDIVDRDKAKGVAERLMAPDMFSGWGIRTLSAESPAYNPMSYHNGSVWPHDNAIVASGLKRYGFDEATEKIAAVLFDAAVESRESRLPELFCGFNRRLGVPFVAYPVACRPQAWAAAAPFMVLQALLGISARAPERALTINQPDLPSWLERLELRDLRVADARVSLAFTRDGNVTSFSLVDRQGDLRVTLQE